MSNVTNDSLELAKQVIQDEASALLALKDSLNDSFLETVRLVTEMEQVGRVVISGMGKAGFIGQKISATLASVGTPSYFLHPAEAVHGDLGRYTKYDLALLLSKSGETQEVLEMLPFLRRVGCPVVAITTSKESKLGRSADTTIEIGAHEEAGPLGLAPTTSTTVMLAVGDALAMVLQKVRGLSEEDFAGYHPAGSLGRSLLTAKEIMRSGDELCAVTEEMLCKEVLHQITDTRGRPGAAAVVDGNGILTGIFTDGDLRRCLDKDPSFLEEPVSTHMGRDPKVITPETLVREATELMNERRIDQLIVVDKDKRPIGLVDIQDAVSVRLR